MLDASEQIISSNIDNIDRGLTTLARIACNANNDTLSKLISNMIMTQRIMLRDRKYLHAELIDPRNPLVHGNCWRIIIAFSNHEIAVTLFATTTSVVVSTQLQKYEQDYTERYFANVSSKQNLRRSAHVSRANEQKRTCARGK